MSTLVQLKKIIASYGGETADAVRYLPADYVINGMDLITIAVNNAMRTAERLHDFDYASDTATISIASTGTLLSAAVMNPGGTIKRVQDVMLPIAGSEYIPCEFMTDEGFRERLSGQIGRQPYDASATLDGYGIGSTGPLATQDGQIIKLYPADQFTFPVAAQLRVIRFMPELSGDSDTNFFTEIGSDYLQWQGIVELNRLTKNFSVRPSEGDVTEPMDLAQIAFESLLQWDRDVRKDTSTPDAGSIPQLPRPKGK